MYHYFNFFFSKLLRVSGPNPHIPKPIIILYNFVYVLNGMTLDHVNSRLCLILLSRVQVSSFQLFCKTPNHMGTQENEGYCVTGLNATQKSLNV